MRHPGVLLVVAAAAGCASSATYTVPAAILNGAVAAGASLEQRASGGCFAVCTNGTTCNPRTGYCEQPPPGATCAPGSIDCGQPAAYEVCRRDETGTLRCVPVMGVSQPPKGVPSEEVLRPVMGISPATGTALPPPSEASPKPPGAP
jgi:hypothetical protein